MVSDIEALCWYAKHNSNIWNLTSGCYIVHRDQQYGKFIINKTKGSHYIIISSVDHGEKKYALDSIIKYFDNIIIPETNEELKKLIYIAKNEITKKNEIALREYNKESFLRELRNRYNIPKYKDTKLMIKIDDLIIKIDRKNILDKNEEKVLLYNKLFIALAMYHEELFNVGQKWSIVKAGKYWRYAKNPQRSIELTNITLNNDDRLNSAIQTNRGAAFLDIGLHDESIKCANKALEYDNRGCCPYNLLGSIYFNIGDLDKSDEYFSIAESKKGFELGETKEIRDIIKNMRANNEQNSGKIIARRFNKIFSIPEKITLEYDDPI